MNTQIEYATKAELINALASCLSYRPKGVLVGKERTAWVRSFPAQQARRLAALITKGLTVPMKGGKVNGKAVRFPDLGAVPVKA